jgi:hypothetical protein
MMRAVTATTALLGVAAGLLLPGAVGSVRAQTVEAVWELTPGDDVGSVRFGRSVAVAGDLVVVGATGDRTNGELSGAVHVFRRSGGGWERTKIVPEDGEPEARFGWKVATDGTRVVVTAPWASNRVEGRRGKVYLYEPEGDTWRPRLLRVSDPDVDGQIGRGLAMGGGRIAIGAPFDTNANGKDAGALVVLEEGPSGWSSTTLIPRRGAPEGWFGITVAADGGRIGAGGYNTAQTPGPEAGAASVFERDGRGSWVEHPLAPRVRPEAGDHFGRGLALTGRRAFVGAEEDDNGNGTDAGGVFALSLDDRDRPPRLVIPDDGAPRSYLGYVVATTDALLAASEDREVRLFALDPAEAGPTDGVRLSTLLDRRLPGGVLALAGQGRLLAVGMPFATEPVEEAGTVLVVEVER